MLVADEALVRQLADGDMQALATLYGRHRGLVMMILRQQGTDANLLEDLCHEVFLVLTDVAHRLRPEASARSFLVGIAMRKAKRLGMMNWVRLKLQARHLLAPEPTAAPQARVDAAHDVDWLLGHLPADWRTVVVLNLVEGWSADEIAEALNVSPNTVYTRLHRARARLLELRETP